MSFRRRTRRFQMALREMQVNGTFGYGHILYHESLADFLEGANREVARVRSANDLNRTTAINIISVFSLAVDRFHFDLACSDVLYTGQ